VILEGFSMPAYLVRLIKNRDIVGFFAADEFEDLVIAVDECTDVPACEYVELPPGGIMWTGPTLPVPLDRGDPDDDGSKIEVLPWARLSSPSFGGTSFMATRMKRSGRGSIRVLR
jgi:hypothetical protein